MTKKLIIISTCIILALAAVSGYLNYFARRLPANTPAKFLAAPEADKKGKKVIVCAGDSITHASVSCNYPGMLAESLPADSYTVINAGINSELSWNLLNRIDEIIACKPFAVTVLIGTNDANATLSSNKSQDYVRRMLLPRDPDREWFRSNLGAICARLKKAGVPHIALLSLPPMGEDLSHEANRRAVEYRAIIKNTAAAHGIAYLPLGEKMVEYLEKNPHRPLYAYEDMEYLMYLAIIRHYLLLRPWNDVARAHGHLLLTDMLHVNCTGAAMAVDLIERFITEVH